MLMFTEEACLQHSLVTQLDFKIQMMLIKLTELEEVGVLQNQSHLVL